VALLQTAQPDREEGVTRVLGRASIDGPTRSVGRIGRPNIDLHRHEAGFVEPQIDGIGRVDVTEVAGRPQFREEFTELRRRRGHADRRAPVDHARTD